MATSPAWGALVQGVLAPILPALGSSHGTLVIVGMAAFFAAVVRAPFTGIILIAEMTAATTLLVPMFATCVAAVLVCMALRGEPIYDTLCERMLRDARPSAPQTCTGEKDQE